ncbi:MAG: lamin tail domain-containing protein, partial [Deltaproteobacteria bacterium]|nr:lamin tail domain-containing protein [Deltaproteobacteria bacterium]
MRATAAIAALTSTLLFGCGDDGSPIAGEDCISNIGEGELVITEIYGNSPGADEGNEWFEIYNATSRTLNVGGMLLVKTNDEGEARKEHVMRELVLDPGDYVVVGGILEEFRAKFEYIDYGYGPDLGTLGNTAGRLMLMCGNDQIDRVDYIDLAEAKSAQLSGLISPPNAIDNDDFGNFCLASQNAFFADELGTPGEANEICAPLTQDDCIDNGMQRAVNKAQAGDIEIAEIMANPDAVGDDVGEWLELRINASIDLNGIQLGRAEPDTEEEPGPGEIRQTLAAIECLPVTAGDYVVLVRSTDPGENGGVTDPSGGVGTPLLYPLDFSLTNSTDGVYVGLAGAVYDVFTYASSSTGTATQIDLEGDFCDATEVYGAGDEGTPGAANGECETVVIVPDGMCIDSDGTTIRAINNPTNVGDVL